MKRGFGTNFHSVYANNAELYDRFSKAEVFSEKLLSTFKKSFIGDTMLDIACGTCHKADMFSKYFEKVYALDLSAPLLKVGRDNYSKNKKLTFLLSSADKIPLLDNSVDTIIITWGSFPLTKTLREIKRVLKPGGIALRIGANELDEFTSLFPKFDTTRLERIKKQFIKAGYSKEVHDVSIEFASVKEAKEVLCPILGIEDTLIKKQNINHKVVLFTYQKPITS